MQNKKLIQTIFSILAIPFSIAAQPQLYTDINAGGNSNPSNFIVFNDSLFFSAEDGINGIELWKKNGSGASMVANINSGDNSNPSFLYDADSMLLFAADNGTNGVELWKYQNGAVQMVMDINTGGNSNPQNFTSLNGMVYFQANDGTNGVELWKTDGDTAILVNNINGSGSSDPQEMVLYDNHIYFQANDGLTGTELYRTDGSVTERVTDINFALYAGSSPKNLTVFDGVLYFSATDGFSGTELWRTDGVFTYMLSNISVLGSSNPDNFISYNNELYFSATSDIWGRELYKTNGLIVTLVSNIASGASSSSPDELTIYGNYLIFSANSVDEIELWRYNGTSTQQVMDINDTGDGLPSQFTVIGSELFFSARDSNGMELWSSNGDTAIKVANMNANGSFDPLGLIVLHDTLYFAADSGTNGNELWSYVQICTTPSISTHPDSIIACEGLNTEMSINTGGNVFRIQWQVNDGSGFENIADNSNYEGSTDSTLTLMSVTTLMDSNTYRCIVFGNCGGSDTSEIAFLDVYTSPEIINTLEDIKTCPGTDTSIQVIASGDNLIYQWQINTGNGYFNLSNSSIYTGVNTNQLDISNITLSMEGYLFRCLIAGSCSPVYTSDDVEIIMDTTISLLVDQSTVTSCEDSLVSITITPIDEISSYQWQMNSGSGFTNLSESGSYVGVTTDSLTVKNLDTDQNNYYFRVLASNACGSSYSDSIKLRVLDDPKAIFDPTVIDLVSIGGQGVLTFTGGITKGVNLTNNSFYAQSYLWDFGDGNFSNESVPSTNIGLVDAIFGIQNTYIYDSPGIYFITLSVFNQCGSSSATLSVDVTEDTISDGLTDISELDLHIYPNPTNELLTICGELEAFEFLEILSIDGKMMYSSPLVNKTSVQLNLSIFEPGVYVIHLRGEHGLMSRQIEKY